MPLWETGLPALPIDALSTVSVVSAAVWFWFAIVFFSNTLIYKICRRKLSPPLVSRRNSATVCPMSAKDSRVPRLTPLFGCFSENEQRRVFARVPRKPGRAVVAWRQIINKSSARRAFKFRQPPVEILLPTLWHSLRHRGGNRRAYRNQRFEKIKPQFYSARLSSGQLTARCSSSRNIFGYAQGVINRGDFAGTQTNAEFYFLIKAKIIGGSGVNGVIVTTAGARETSALVPTR